MQALEPGDLVKCQQYATWLLGEAIDDTLNNNCFAVMDRIIPSDEATFKLNGSVNRHNCVYWARENPYEVMPKVLNAAGVTVCAGICTKGIAGPFFFNGTCNGD